MRTRLTLLCLAGLTLPATTRADEPTPDALYKFLQAEAGKHFDARRQAVAALKTPEDVRRRQQELRKFFLDSLGDLPEKTPLNARVVGRKQCDGYTVERVVYESRPDHHVTASFYLPEGKGPFPGVLVPCGHSANGKAAEAYQRVSILMAKNGLAVLCYDPIGQGERIQLLDAAGKPAIKGSTSEHTLTGIGALLVGRQTATYRIWDGFRSMDYLASRPEVDPKRLGCTGNSGGGTMTAYLMALDERIVAAAPSCYMTTLERLFATIGPQDAEQNITGQVAFGMEHADYVTLRAPKPTLLLTGTQDFFDIQGAWTNFRESKLIYGMMGHGERVDLFEYNDKHGFTKPRREAAMRWMRRWLLEKDDAPSEGDFPIQTDAELQVTRTGQVLSDLKGKSVFDLNREREQELEPIRAKFLKQSGRDGLVKEIRRLLAVKDEVEKPKPNKAPSAAAIFIETEPGLKLKLAYHPPLKAGLNGKVAICLHDEGVKGLDALGERVREAAGGDAALVYLEVRGTGLTAPKAPTWANQLGREVKEAFLGLHINRPLLGQRVHDVLSLVAELSEKKSLGEIHLIGFGGMGPVALHAAALDSRIKHVTLDGALTSWSSVVRTPLGKAQLPNVVPGVLAYYDLPDLAAALAPRPLAIRAPVDAAGVPVNQAEAEKIYSAARAAYENEKRSKNLVLQTLPRP